MTPMGTLDDLDERVTALEQMAGDHERRLEDHDQHLDKHDVRIGQVVGIVEGIDLRIAYLEKRNEAVLRRRTKTYKRRKPTD